MLCGHSIPAGAPANASSQVRVCLHRFHLHAGSLIAGS